MGEGTMKFYKKTKVHNLGLGLLGCVYTGQRQFRGFAKTLKMNWPVVFRDDGFAGITVVLQAGWSCKHLNQYSCTRRDLG